METQTIPADSKFYGLLQRTEMILALTREILENRQGHADTDRAMKDMALDLRNIILK